MLNKMCQLLPERFLVPESSGECPVLAARGSIRQSEAQAETDAHD